MFFPNRILPIAITIVLLALVACDKEHPTSYEAPINSLFLVLTPDNGGNPVVLSYLDRDGTGGLPAIINDGVLNTNTTYTAQLAIPKAKTNSFPLVKHITDSATVMGQPELHQVFFTPQNGLKLHTEYSDADDNGLPIGFLTSITTGNASTGGLRLIVIHAPNKLGDNVVLGNIGNTGGQIDLEITFNITIQAAK